MKMKLVNKWLIMGCILIILLCLSACREKEQENNEPDEKMDVTDVDSVIRFYNNYTDRLAERMEKSDDMSGSELLDAISELSFSIDQFTHVGNNATSPDLVIFRDNTLFVSGREYDGVGDYFTYRNLIKIYDKGILQINSNGDDISVSTDTLDIGSMSGDSFNIEKIIESLSLGAEDITALQKEKMYRLEKAYIQGLVEALGLSNDDLSALGLTLDQLYELTYTLDFSDYDEKRIVELSISGKELKNSVDLIFDLSEDRGEEGKITLSLSIASVSISGAIEWEDKDSFEASANISMPDKNMKAEISYSYSEAEDLPSLSLSVKIKVDEEEQLLLELNAAKDNVNRYRGSIALNVKDTEDDGGVLPTADVTPDNTFSEDAKLDILFDIGLNDKDELLCLNCDATISAEDGKLVLKLAADLSDVKKKGSKVATLEMSFTELVEGKAIENSMIFTVTTESCTMNSASFSVVGTMTDGNDEETVMATLNWPASSDIQLNEEEEKYLLRADSLYENYDMVKKKIDSLNSDAIVYVQTLMKSDDPVKFYYFDQVRDLCFFTDITFSGNQFYVNTNLVIDYDDLLYFYCKHNGDFTNFLESEATAEARKLQNLINKLEEGYTSSIGGNNLIFSHYLPERELYMLMIPGYIQTASFYTERITQDMISGYVLHEIPGDVDSIEDIHNFEVTYYDDCRKNLLCKDCAHVFISNDPMHEMSDEIEIRRADDENSGVTFSSCKNCGGGSMVFTDQNGYQLTIRLSKAKNEQSEFEKIDVGKYGDKDLIIKEIICDTGSANYTGDINIPNIEEKTGYRIVGAVYTPAYYQFSKNCALVLPEGLEFIGDRAFRNCGFTSVSFPQSLLVIGNAAFQNCHAKEIVIPENVTYFSSDAFDMRELEKLTVNARFLEEFYLPSNAQNLKEIVLNGRIGKFFGSSSYTAETFVIPEGVTSIAGFGGNAYIKKIVLPSTLLTIDDNAFSGCTYLEEVVLSEALISIGSNAFSECTSLKRMWVASDGAIEAVNGQFILPDTLNHLGGYAFNYCVLLESVNIPPQVKVISSGVFGGCEKLMLVKMHNAITEIGHGAFAGCVKLKEIKMPTDLTVIDDLAFSKCVLLKDENVVFGEKLHRIGNRAFEDCVGIRNLRFPESLVYLDTPFDGCQIDTLYFAGQFNGGLGVFANEITLAKGFADSLPFARVINIMSDDVPDGEPHIMSIISDAVLVINFAGDEEEWNKGNFIVGSGTVINFNVNFDEENSDDKTDDGN